MELDPDVQAVAVRHLGTDPRGDFVRADVGEWLSSYASGLVVGVRV
ncbi:hypothetical protein [Phytohabitans kaempferiae]|uniref:Uncharacterized protein n=1 Tax=Phytohabitans kaempferiae TaxID=1620943 RepID=A0ABV6MEW2_9ACTN